MKSLLPQIDPIPGGKASGHRSGLPRRTGPASLPQAPHASPCNLPAAWPAAEAWQTEEIVARLEEAAQTLRLLGMSGRDRPRGMAAKWPEIVQKSMESYDAAAIRRRPAPPEPRAISRTDAAVLWLLWISDDERRIVWGRACGIPWRRLEDLDGRSHTTLRKVRAAGLDRIRARLNAEG